MSVDTALQIIKREFSLAESSSDVDEILFDFLGGEPFLEFELIRHVAETTWSQPQPVPYLFSVTTNGTLLDEGMKSWLRAHTDRFKVVLSLDGITSAQNVNRPESVQFIDMDFFREVYADQPIKMTVSPETVETFSDGVIKLIKDGFCVAPSFAYGVAWPEASVREYGRQLGMLANWFLRNPTYEPIPQFQKRLGVVLDDGDIRRMCGTGRMMATYDIDGKSYPCHLFLPWITGKTTGFESVCSDEDLCDRRCVDCSIVRICKHCYGFNFIENGNPCKRSEYVCRLMREEIQACVYYKGTLLGKKVRRGDRLPEDEFGEARAVLYISGHCPIELIRKQEVDADE